MKKLCFALLFLLMLLPCAALADTVQLSDFLLCSVGEMRLPIYPDYAAYIGEGLTKEDFDITYASSSRYVTVEADGTVYISASAKQNANYPLEITYTPKVEGVGVETVFQARLMTLKAIPEITTEQSFYRLRAGGFINTVVELHGGNTSLVASVTADSDVVDVTSSQWGADSIKLHITALKHGTATITIQTYSGLTETIELDVIGPPTQFKFAQEHFIAHIGETVDLGLDMGNGPYGLEYYYTFGKQVYRDGQVWSNGVIGTHNATFRAGQGGEYRIVFSWEGGVTGECRITVVDYARCEDIAFSTGSLYLNREANILLLNQYGEEIYRPFTITKGAELVKLDYRRITVEKPGLVEITVQNEDGSTTVKAFDVQAIPTQMTLNADALTLGIGETFDLEVRFDQGSDGYTYGVHSETAMTQGLCPVRMEGDRIIAQAPGTAVITVYARELTACCTVTVPDSDLAVRIVYPELLGVNRSHQLAVTDRTGKEYPVLWHKGDGECLTVTADGLVTGVHQGYQTVTATLEDGRVLTQRLQVVQIPGTLEHPPLTVHENWTTVALSTITADTGILQASDVIVTVADESIATYTSDSLFFKFHKPGTTTVTLTAKQGGAQGRFTLTVLEADNTLYIHDGGKVFANSHIVGVPDGYYITMPQLTDYYGHIVPVTWRIVEDMPAGSPTGVGFYFDGEVLACSWADANCILEATSAQGGTFQLSAYGYRIAKEIRFRQESCTIRVGELISVSVEGVDNVYVGPVFWTLDTESIVAFTPSSASYSEGFVGGLRPGTATLTATLINGATASCTITVVSDTPARLPGDANEDGSVDIMDALLVLQYDVGWDVAINAANANVDGDDSVSIMDALLILQYDVGWDVELQ